MVNTGDTIKLPPLTPVQRAMMGDTVRLSQDTPEYYSTDELDGFLDKELAEATADTRWYIRNWTGE